MDNEDEKKEPVTETPPEPEKVAEKPTETAQEAKPTDDIAETVRGLDAKVTELASIVQGLLPDNRDETPVKRPWTHKRFF